MRASIESGGNALLQCSQVGLSSSIIGSITPTLLYCSFVRGLTIISVFSKIANMNLVYKALADPTRRKILELLRDRDLSAGEIAAHFHLAKPTLSGHFAILKAADLVQADKVGTTVIYHLNVSVLEEALLSLMSVFNLPSPQPYSSMGDSRE
jgi:ArsR family transcriptional regulator, arsenate/arsenite/antimonite-responsive transcriptional repressor